MTDSQRGILLLSTIAAIFACAGTYFFAEERSEQRARQALISAASSASGAQLNGQLLDDPSVILRALQTLHPVHAHHSSPRASIRISLVGSSGVTEVVIARDSYVSGEFWVYRAGSNWHGDPHGQSAGRIRSEELDGFLARRGL